MFSHSLSKPPFGHTTVSCTLFVVDIRKIDSVGVVACVDGEVVATLDAPPEINHVFGFAI